MTTRTALAALTAAALAVLAAAPAANADDCPPIPRAVCGSLTLPLDRAHPERGTTPVGYIWIRHREPGPAVSTIVPNPGGPGDTTTVFADRYAELLDPLLDDHDLLLVDARGTGRSGPLDCGLDLSVPLTSRGVVHQAVEICGRNLGEKGRAYTSAAISDDIEDVRIHLGIGQVDLLGQSYGTYLMQVHASRHPRAIRSIVLSSAYPLDFDMWARHNIAAVRRAVRAVCDRSGGRCDGERVLRDLAVLAHRLRRSPLRYEAVGHTWLLDDTALAALVYRSEPASWGILPAVVRAAVKGDPSRLLAMAAEVLPPSGERAAAAQEPPPAFSIALTISVVCNDYPTLWNRSAPVPVRKRQFERALRAQPARAFAPFTARSWPQAIFDRGDICLRWPDRHGPTQPTEVPLPDVPVLVLSGELDPNTPTEEGRQAARDFARAKVVEVPNAGHVPEATQPCAAAIEVGFLRDLRVPDTSCLHDIPPIPVEP